MKSTQLYKNTTSIFSVLAVSIAGSPSVQAESSEQLPAFGTAHSSEFNSELTMSGASNDYTSPSLLAMQDDLEGGAFSSTLFDDSSEDDEDDDQELFLASVQGTLPTFTMSGRSSRSAMSAYSSGGGPISITDEDVESLIAAVDHTVDYQTQGVIFKGTSSADKPTLGSLTGSVKVNVTGSSAVDTKGVNLENAIVGTVSSEVTVNVTSGSVSGVVVNNTDVDSISGVITATGQNSADGITLQGTGNVGSINGVKISVSGGNAVVGVNIVGSEIEGEGSGTVGANGGTFSAGKVDISVTSIQGSSFVRVADKGTMGTIWGDFTMTTNNTSTNSWDLLNTFSVGYVLGYDKAASSSSIGFYHKYTDTVTGGTRFTSDGYLIDWDKTTMSITRNLGLAAGAAVVSREGGLDLDTIALLKNIKFGSSSKFDVTIKDGMATGTWLNGVDTSEGKMLGTINTTALKGSAVGLLTVGTDEAYIGLVTQSKDNTKLGHVSGTISASVNEETATGKSIGLQLGNVANWRGYDNVLTGESTTYTTSVKELSGDISAAMYKDAESEIETSLVAGIVDVGFGADGSTKVLNFNADANGTTWDIAEVRDDEDKVTQEAVTGDAAIALAGDQAADLAGTSVKAIYYDIDAATNNPKAIGLGHAIVTLAGGITVNSVGTRDPSAKVTFVGNLTAGFNTTTGAVGTESITFMKGNYDVTSDSWKAAKGVTLGTKSATPGGLHEIAQVDLKDLTIGGGTVGQKTEIVASTLNFTANSSASASQIHVGAGNDLDLDGLQVVNIYLSGDESNYTSTVYFVDARSGNEFTADGEVYDSVVTESTGGTQKYQYNIYFNNDTDAHTQHANFKIVHDATGIYLHIPEPSTATLSLLALAGLMARRRRRHV